MPEPEPFALAYQDSCSGPTVLFIHGFPLNSSLWEPQMEDLNDTARLLAPDLRGYGLSPAGEGPYSMEMLAGDCMGLLDTLGVQPPIVLCGHSMGGYIAFEFYRRYPELVAGLVLVATRAAADTPEARENRDRAVEKVREEGPAALSTGMLPKLLAPDNYENDDKLVAFVREMIDSASVNGIVGALEAMKERPDSTPLLPEIDVPTLVIHGEEDTIVPLAEAERMAEAIPDAELVTIPNAGHLPNLEGALHFNESLWDYLETLKEERSE